MHALSAAGGNWIERFATALRSPPPSWLLLVMVLGLTAFYLVFAFWYGPILTPDGERDIEYARLLVALDFDLGAYQQQADVIGGAVHPTPKLFTLSYLALLAALDALLGDRLLSGLLVVNALAQAATAAMVLLLATRVAATLLSLLVAAAFLISSFDFYQWAAMSQSEPIFIVVATAMLWLAVAAATSNASGARAAGWIGAAALMALAVFTRPPWPPLAATLAGVVVLAPTLRTGFSRRTVVVYGRWMLAAAALATLLIIASAAAHFDPMLLPEGVLRAATELWRDELAGGVVVIDRPETYIGPQDSVIGFAAVMFVRLLAFFRFTADGFSDGHQIINIAGHVPLYALALLGMLRIFVRPESVGRFVGALAITWIGYFFFLDVFHSVQFLDFDWRYRAPAYPGLILIACLGADTVVDWLGRRKKQQD